MCIIRPETNFLPPQPSQRWWPLEVEAVGEVVAPAGVKEITVEIRAMETKDRALHLQLMQQQLRKNLSGGRNIQMGHPMVCANSITNTVNQLIFVEEFMTVPGGIL